MTENWLPLRDYENLYEISDQGRIRSIVYNWSGEKYIKQFFTLGGEHLMVKLVKNNDIKNLFISRLVLEHFNACAITKNSTPEYIDGNPLNCQSSNLRWKKRYLLDKTIVSRIRILKRKYSIKEISEIEKISTSLVRSALYNWNDKQKFSR